MYSLDEDGLEIVDMDESRKRRKWRTKKKRSTMRL